MQVTHFSLLPQNESKRKHCLIRASAFQTHAAENFLPGRWGGGRVLFLLMIIQFFMTKNVYGFSCPWVAGQRYHILCLALNVPFMLFFPVCTWVYVCVCVITCMHMCVFSVLCNRKQGRQWKNWGWLLCGEKKHLLCSDSIFPNHEYLAHLAAIMGWFFTWEVRFKQQNSQSYIHVKEVDTVMMRNTAPTQLTLS